MTGVPPGENQRRDRHGRHDDTFTTEIDTFSYTLPFAPRRSTAVLPGVNEARSYIDLGSVELGQRARFEPCKYEWRVGTSGSWTEIDDSETSFSISGLAGGTNYTVQVRSKTDAGTSGPRSRTFTDDGRVRAGFANRAQPLVQHGRNGADGDVFSAPSSWGNAPADELASHEYRTGTSGS